MISASHNPFQDNGIKLFGPDGYKLSDEAELAIEAKMSAPVEPLLAEPEKLGRAKRLDDAQGRYIEFAKSTFPKHLRLDGLKIVLDCANGAAYQVGPMILWELGAEVIPLGIKPDGFNINKECGSTHPKHLCETVVKEGAHLGIAVDGDADRLVICDEKGKLLDGDQLMAMIATYWQKTGQLKGNTLVATEMSNMGLEKYLTERNLKLIRTKVGDRYVIEQMRLHGLNLGGEQSGHLIMSDYATTGDGLIAALQILAMMVEERATMSDLGHRFTPYPQILKNIRYGLNNPLEHPNVQKAIAGAKESLAENGRVFIRKSGTEPLIRVMVEAEDQAKMHSIANDLEATILSCLTPHS